MDIEDLRELDATIARRVTGWSKVIRLVGEWDVEDWYGIPRGRRNNIPELVPYYSRNIYLAMEVVEILVNRGAAFSMWMTPPQSSVMNTVAVAFQSGVYPPEFGRDPDNTRICYGYSLPGDLNPSLAICRAALVWIEKSKN